MSVLMKIAASFYKRNLKKQVVTFIAVALASALLSMVSAFVFSCKDMLCRCIALEFGDFHVCFDSLSANEIDKIKNSDLFSQFSSFTIEKSDANGLLKLFIKFKKCTKLKQTKADPAKFVADILSIAGSPRRADSFCVNWSLLGLDIGCRRPDIPKDLDGLFEEACAVLDSFGIFCTVITIIWSIWVISAGFHASAAQKVRYWGILKSIGTTNKQIRNIALYDALILSAVAIPVGLALGAGVFAGCVPFGNHVLKDAFAFVSHHINLELPTFRVVFSFKFFLYSWVLSSFTAFVAAWYPAKKVAASPIIDILRRRHEIKRTKQRVEVSGLVRKFFGIEAVIAAKCKKRNKLSAFTVEVALIFSVVLFLVVFVVSRSVVHIFTLAERNQRKNNGGGLVEYTVSVSVSPGINERRNISEMAIVRQRLESQLHDVPCSHVDTCKKLSLRSKIFSDRFTNIHLFVASNTDYEVYLRAQNLKQAAVGHPFCGIWFANKHENPTEAAKYLPKDSCIALQTRVKEAGCVEFVVLGCTNQKIPLPAGIERARFVDGFGILISEETFTSLLDAFGAESGCESEVTTSFYYTVADKELGAFDRTIHNLVKEAKEQDAALKCNVQNDVLIAKSINGIVFLFQLGVFVFVGLLSLLAVANLISVVSFSLFSRRREFAILRSVGLTPWGFSKMLGFEAFLYVSKALFFGVPIGAFLGWSLTHAMLGNFSDFRSSTRGFPSVAGFWSGIFICVGGLTLVVLVTTLYARNLLKEENIIAGIQDRVN